VVLEAQGESLAAQEALEKLCRTYWRPIYGFVRRQGARTEDAEDLTQGFFALSLERKDLHTVRKAELLGELGDYELLEEIGGGDQAVVFRARQKSLNRTVAWRHHRAFSDASGATHGFVRRP
jgi:hypothetical protein